MTEVEVRLPSWGMGMTEGTITEWLKSEGDQITEGDPLVEVETAKAIEVLPAPVSGTLIKLLASEGDVVEVREVIAVILQVEATE